MNYTFESLINKYDNLVLEEYCYGESYYTEDKKQGLLEKIGEFISNLCEKIMNFVKSFINKIAGKEVFVKVPKGMKEHVKKTESWFELFKKAISAIKKGVFKAIKEIIELMKRHPLITTAIVASVGFVFVKAGVYKEMATKLATIGGRVRDGVKFIIGKKEMIDKDIYDSTVDTLKNSQVALSKTQSELAACKIESSEKDSIIIRKNNEIDSQKNKINILRYTIDDNKSEPNSSKRSLSRLTDDNEKLKNDYDRVITKLSDTSNKYRTSIYDKALMKLNSMKKDPIYREFIKRPEVKEIIDDHIDPIDHSMTEFGYNRLFRHLKRAFDDFNKKK